MSEIVIATESLHKFYGSRDQKVHALNSVDISIEEGEIVGVMGPSGCGKTTLLNCLSGLDSIDSGTILIQGQTLTDLNDDQLSELRAKRMGFVFQTYNLLPVLTAIENVELPLLVSGFSGKEARTKALENLSEVELEDWQHHLPGELSGGQRQRVVLARALVLRPKIIIADEPVSMLDVSIRAEILELMKNIQKKNNISFIYITHDLATARYFGQKIIILYLGKVMESGSIDQVLLKPRHPYTQALIDAISEPDPDNLYKEKVIRINEPLNIDFYSGCRFRARCQYAIDKCENVPELESRDGRNVACFVDITK